jgi:hypothetical protein
MPFDPTELIDSVQRNVGLLPAAIGAILLLAGPTAAWIIYRMVAQPRSARPAAGSTDLMWVCEQCRSANEVRRGSCYRCGFRQDSATGDLHVIDGTGLVVIGEDGRPTTGIPVGPGPDPVSPLIVGPVVAILPDAPPARRSNLSRLPALGDGRAPVSLARDDAEPTPEVDEP